MKQIGVKMHYKSFLLICTLPNNVNEKVTIDSLFISFQKCVACSSYANIEGFFFCIYYIIELQKTFTLTPFISDTYVL